MLKFFRQNKLDNKIKVNKEKTNIQIQQYYHKEIKNTIDYNKYIVKEYKWNHKCKYNINTTIDELLMNLNNNNQVKLIKILK